MRRTIVRTVEVTYAITIEAPDGTPDHELIGLVEDFSDHEFGESDEGYPDHHAEAPGPDDEPSFTYCDGELVGYEPPAIPPVAEDWFEAGGQRWISNGHLLLSEFAAMPTESPSDDWTRGRQATPEFAEDVLVPLANGVSARFTGRVRKGNKPLAEIVTGNGHTVAIQLRYAACLAGLDLCATTNAPPGTIIGGKRDGVLVAAVTLWRIDNDVIAWETP